MSSTVDPDEPSGSSSGLKAATPVEGATTGLYRLKRYLRPLLIPIALSFVAYTAYSLARRWSESPPVRVLPGYFALSVLPLLAGAFFQAQAWVLVIERLSGRDVLRARALALYFDSQLARYAGKLGLPVVRMAGATTIGTSPSLVGASIGIEMLSWLAMGALVGLGASWAFGSLDPLPSFQDWMTPALLVASLLVVACLALWPSNRYPRPAQRFLKQAARGLPLLSLGTPLCQLAYWLAWALHGVLIANSLGVDWSNAVTVSGLFPLATVAGFVVLVTPSGLGMREAVLALGLTPLLGASPALMASVLSRVASLIADFVIWALLRWITRPTLDTRRPP